MQQLTWHPAEGAEYGFLRDVFEVGRAASAGALRAGFPRRLSAWPPSAPAPPADGC